MKKKSKKKTTAGKLLSKSKQRKGRQVHYLFVTVIALLLLIDLPFFMFAGNVRDSIPDYPVKGKMIDEKGKPLPGVTILLDSTQIGTVTGIDGAFSFRLPKAKGTLVFSFIGYENAKKNFLSGQTLIVTLKEKISKLDEVTVIAYGTQNKREVIGAMSTVKANEIKDIPSPSLANLLQGRVAGMNVTNTTGAPGGGGISVTIRGFNSLSIENTRRGSEPLWVVDGVPLLSFTSPVTGSNTLADIDPSSVESVQVLKDAASASIYGSRAANGVILITTKKGYLNQSAKFSVNVSQTYSFNAKLPELTGGKAERKLRLAALDNFAQAYYDYETNTYKYVDNYYESYNEGLHYNYLWNQGYGAAVPIYQDSLNPFYNNSTNLFKYYFRTGKVTDANIQLSKGYSTFFYNIGLGYYTEKGVLKNTGFNRVNLIGNFNLRPFDRLEANFRMYIARTGRDRSSYDMLVSGFTSAMELEQIPSQLLNYSTVLPGPNTQTFQETIERYNEVKEKNEAYRLRGSFDLSYEIVKGLTIKSSVAADVSLQYQNLFMPANLDEYNETYSSGQHQRTQMLLNENLITYKRGFNDKHNIDLLAGLSYQMDQKDDIGGWGKAAPSDLIQYVPWAGNVYDTENKRQLKDYMTSMERSTLMGIFGRVNYNYLQKYLFSFTFRRDGSSKFGKNVRWGNFPSLALGWTISDEKFMDWSRGTLDYCKFRASWSKSGRQFDQPYIALGLLEANNPFLGYPTVTPDFGLGLINQGLTWEKTDQYDLGLDMDLFNHRLAITLDYYYRYTNKLLYLVVLQGNYSGYIQQWQNAYCISNQGVELNIKWNVLHRENLNWNLEFNIARNWNRLEKSQDKRDFTNYSSPDNLNIIGKPLNGIYAYQTAGYYQDYKDVPHNFIAGKDTPLGTGTQFYRAGDRIIVDNNGDGQIDFKDRVFCGSPLPIASGGVITTLNYKGFDVSILFNYVLGRHILNKGIGASVGTSLGMSAEEIAKPVFTDIKNISFWQKKGDNTDYPVNRLEAGLNNFGTAIAANVQNASYMKLKTLTIGYTLPESVKKFMRFGIRVFVTGENLFTITNYKGADPESVDTVTGIDGLGNYPLSTRLAFGLTLNL
ncbi:SusC/RagA family TonB-linked outer membrane protein [Butyricimonas faecihominis]|uniref:SusC/RagA family TonB-linked outer membrane protein n=1 Tax=Butyricimonas faecihominis TaxID=1472416 RepID=UPI00266EDBCE|nr:SusC/RagA family TonB-linked outer membrane protein [Butyricimonas faecihominis]